LGVRATQWLIPLPVVGAQIGHYTLHGRGGVVPWLEGRHAAIPLWYSDRLPIRIDKNFVSIETVPFSGIIRTVCPPGIYLTWLDFRNEYMPVIEGAILLEI
jgi:hypothetical protein